MKTDQTNSGRLNIKGTPGNPERGQPCPRASALDRDSRTRLSALRARGSGSPLDVGALLPGRIFATIIFTLAIIAARAQAGSIGLNFIGNPDTSSGVMMPEDKAGLPAVAQTNWNNAAKASGVLNKLPDASGKMTTVAVIWHSGMAIHGGLGTHGLKIEDKGDDSRMMRGYLDAGAGDESATVTFTGIPYAWYDVIVYFDGDTDARVRVGAYTVNGVTVYGKDVADFDGTFTEVEQTDSVKVTAGNYVRFTGQTGSSCTVRAEGISAPDEYLRAPINGIQIVEVVAPVTIVDEQPTAAK